jgi:membrane fusion protein, multidrug efflux system
MPSLTRASLSATVLLALAACKAPSQPTAEQPAEAARARAETKVRVETARLVSSDATLSFTFPGEVEGSRDALLAAALGGLVEAVLVKQGDQVTAGQPLLRVDTRIHGARLEQAQADLEQAQAELKRALDMGEAASRAMLDGARTRLRISEAGLKLAAAQHSRSIVRAPFAGTVAQLAPEVGEVAAPGAPVLRLVQLAPVKVTVSVADRDVGAVRVGTTVNVHTDANPEIHQGIVRFVSPASDLRTRAFKVEIEVPNPDGRLLPGMIARAHVKAEAAKDALVVPQDVLVTRRTDVGVFVEDQGRASWRPLELGEIVGEQVVVKTGLARGDRLVVTGHRELVDGDLLDVARDGVCCTRGRVSFDKQQVEAKR